MEHRIYHYQDFQSWIEKEIQENALLRKRKPEQLYEPVSYILSIGGKRIRPALVLMAANLFTDQLEGFVKPALAMEVFHNFTLLHDDIMDSSDLRRGHPTVHKKWNSNVAILSGDAMAILSYQLLLEHNSAFYKEILEVFNQVALQVCEGQQYDMDFEHIAEVEEEEYLQMIRLKTSVLLAGSMKIGALLAESQIQDADLLYEFGLNIGIAFQIQDDYLDTFGDPTQFQKVIGGDILAGKKTFLVIQAMKLATDPERSQLNKWLIAKDMPEQEKISAVTELFKNLQIDKYIQEMQLHYYHLALSALEQVNVPKERKEILFHFARKLFERKY
jgi:geranylgeranyl diphosphate synthase, type II